MIWSGLRYRLHALFRRGAMERELSDELRFHLEHQIEKHLRAGVSPAEAVRRSAPGRTRVGTCPVDPRDDTGGLPAPGGASARCRQR